MPTKEQYIKHAEKYKKYSRNYYYEHRKQCLERQKKYKNRIRPLYLEREHILKQNWKFSVLAIYSKGQPKCACCGETTIEFLTIDHINGGGTKHTAQKGIGAGTGFYRWLTKNDFPEGFQCLCMNCNFARRWGKRCPHEERRMWQQNAKTEEEND